MSKFYLEPLKVTIEPEEVNPFKLKEDPEAKPPAAVSITTGVIRLGKLYIVPPREWYSAEIIINDHDTIKALWEALKIVVARYKAAAGAGDLPESLEAIAGRVDRFRRGAEARKGALILWTGQPGPPLYYYSINNYQAGNCFYRNNGDPINPAILYPGCYGTAKLNICAENARVYIELLEFRLLYLGNEI